MKQFTISPNESGQRFDKYLKKLLSNASGSFIYKMLRKKNITLNDHKADGTEKLASGDHKHSPSVRRAVMDGMSRCEAQVKPLSN